MPPLTLTPQRQKQKLTEIFIAWLVEEAERDLVYTLWEDLQWADPSTLEVLTLYLDQLPMARTLAVFTARPEFLPPWGSRSYMSHLPLSTLPRIHSEAMVKTIMGDRALSSEIIGQIAERSDGNPLFVEELAKSVVETVEATGRSPLQALEVPTTLQDVLLARLDRLGPARATAQLGAVLGREFTYEMLQAVGVFDDDTLQQTLPKLVETELVYQRGLGAQARYTFKHALIHDAAYQSLLRRTRQQYHHQTVRTLEERFPETKETQPELLAHHYTEAGLGEQAIAYWQAAGQKAIARSANVEARRHLEMGLELLKALPESPERQQRELALQMTLGVPLMATKGFAAPEVESAYAHARELCQQLGESARLAPVLWGLSGFHLVRGELLLGQELAERGVILAEGSHDPVVQGEAHHLLGANLLYRGKLAEASAHWNHVFAFYDPQQHERHVLLYGQDSGVVARGYAGWTLWMLGYPDQARRISHAALTLAHELRNPQSSEYALQCAAVLHGWLQEWSTMQSYAARITALAIEQGLPLWQALGTLSEGWVSVAQGHGDTGLSLVRQGAAAYQATGAQVPRAWQLCVQAQVCLLVQQFEEGWQAACEALAHIEHTDERWYEAEVWRTKGELVLAQAGKTQQSRGKGHQSPVATDPRTAPRDSHAEAEEYFRKAMNVARGQQAKSWQLRAATSLARLWQQQGKRAEAHGLLSEVYTWFTEGFDTADLQDAKALLDILSSARKLHVQATPARTKKRSTTTTH